MIDGKPNYTRLSTIAMADVVLMDPEGRNQFINALCEMFENILDPDYQPAEKPGFVGRAIQRQFVEFREGTKKYMENVNRNPSGLPNRSKTPPGNPLGTQLGNCGDNPKRKEIEKEPEKEPEKEKKKKTFAPPTLEEVRAYCQERNNNIDPEYFINYYTARGWELKQGQKVKDWKACIRTWELNQKGGNHYGGGSASNKEEGGAVHRTNYSFLRDTIESV